MEITFVNVKYEKDEFSDTINISRYSEYVDDTGHDYITNSYVCIAAVYDRVLDKYFISSDKECCHGGHKFNNVSGSKKVFQELFKGVFEL